MSIIICFLFAAQVYPDVSRAGVEHPRHAVGLRAGRGDAALLGRSLHVHCYQRSVRHTHAHHIHVNQYHITHYSRAHPPAASNFRVFMLLACNSTIEHRRPRNNYYFSVQIKRTVNLCVHVHTSFVSRALMV
jgi:hypothetical protein